LNTVECVCRFCGKKEVKPRSHRKVYCSRRCNALDREMKYTKIYTCGCGKQVRKADSNVKFNFGVYCSMECYLKYKTYTSRSRNEELFYSKVRELFPSAEANVFINGREADILIRDKNLAIHWNGAWHYKPIRGEELLKTIQRRDIERYDIFAAAGYKNHIIRDDGMFNPDKVSAEIVALKAILD
jgi:hypothetical protein